MDAVRIHLILHVPREMQDTLMYSIEESLPVEWTAFEYDGKLYHLVFLNNEATLAHAR